MKSKPEEKNKGATNHPTQHHWHEMNRKERRETMRKMQSEDLSLEVIHPDAAGIDIGNESHYAAVPPSRDSQSVREFGCTTAEPAFWPATTRLLPFGRSTSITPAEKSQSGLFFTSGQ